MNASLDDATRRELIAYLRTIAHPGRDVDGIGDEINLFETGVLDSLAVIEIIEYLEQKHGLDFARRGLQPADLTTLEAMLRLIKDAAR